MHSISQGNEEMAMTRVDHCVQILRREIMCAGDTTPYLILSTPGQSPTERPDFDTLHYCRSFSKIKSGQMNARFNTALKLGVYLCFMISNHDLRWLSMIQ